MFNLSLQLCWLATAGTQECLIKKIAYDED